jgi:deoxyribodipyrimidine photolyase-related protein
MSSAILVFPHQLFEAHPAMSHGGEVYLLEDPLIFGNDVHWPTAMHQQKIMLHRASMKAYAEEIEASGRVIHYIEAPDNSATDTVQLLNAAIPKIFSEAVHTLQKRSC